MIGGEECNLRGFFRVDSSGALDDSQTSTTGQVRFQWFEWVNADGSLVEASVSGIGFFYVGKKGVPS